uniref:Uncharacterized protein n=1 Tax=Octopus bimaculoides TaxID=37653 RepID=A0A0L8FTQ5_OCTBM
MYDYSVTWGRAYSWWYGSFLSTHIVLSFALSCRGNQLCTSYVNLFRSFLLISPFQLYLAIKILFQILQQNILFPEVLPFGIPPLPIFSLQT